MTQTEEIRMKVGAIKGRKGWDNEMLAKRLKCSSRTVARLIADPSQVTFKWVMRINQMYEDYC